jgi:hypothetical protein
MAYDPKRPESIFEGDNLFQFAIGLNNAYQLKHGIGDADPFREDVGVCMVALGDAQQALGGVGDEK